jgi:hypothetical protein
VKVQHSHPLEQVLQRWGTVVATAVVEGVAAFELARQIAEAVPSAAVAKTYWGRMAYSLFEAGS